MVRTDRPYHWPYKGKSGQVTLRITYMDRLEVTLDQSLIRTLERIREARLDSYDRLARAGKEEHLVLDQEDASNVWRLSLADSN